MTNLREFYKEANDKVMGSYKTTLAGIKEVVARTRDFGQAGEKKEYYRFFNTAGNLLLKLADFEERLGEDYLKKKSLEELKKEKDGFYEEVVGKAYDTCYANPGYGVKIFGEGLGQLFSYLYMNVRALLTFATYHKIFMMERYNRMFLEAFEYVDGNTPEYEAFKHIVTQLQREQTIEDHVLRTRESYDKDYSYITGIVTSADLDAPRYLFAYPRYITDNEIKTSEFLASYPADKIEKLAAQITNSYIEGFARDNKDLSKKSTVTIHFSAGQERIVRQLIKNLAEKGLVATESIVRSTPANKQYRFDYKFNSALFLDEAYAKQVEDHMSAAYSECADILKASSGVVLIEEFGEAPFKPENKKEMLRFTPDQQKLAMLHQNRIAQMYFNYIPRSETSFTIIAFPSPKIGDRFTEIFEHIAEVNMLDPARYERIQQKLIDALDKAEYVHVKGKGENETDIKVRMQELSEPGKQTNFMNTCADINIPVGEVFTSPRLAGTDGVLHIAETFLNQLRFVDLKLTFKDGYVTDYTCKNFESEEENRKYIEENLLFPHKTLPIGEFAIGTNTLAYVIAQKYNILDVLPILIIEKMGPHFAVGDTCFSWSEDVPVYNRLNNKEIIARENEKSALRKEDPSKAYTNVHTDITLPYESLDFISSITKDGDRIDLIRDSYFSLAGTEELNEPLKEYLGNS